MKIAIGCDHSGYTLKQVIINLLSELGYSYEDFGCYNTNSVDYPDIAIPLAESVAQKKFEHGILVCNTGIGMSITANKVKGIRAALCCDIFSAHRAREHNDANILCLGEAVTGQGLAREIVSTYLSARFSGGRHAERLIKISCAEE